MRKVTLGDSGITVSRLGFGSLAVCPPGADLTPAEGGGIIAHAIGRGVNFIDTAQYYNNYEYIRRGIESAGVFSAPEKIVVSTKSYAYDRAGAAEAVEQARRELDRDVIDIFMLHEQQSIETLRGHRDALDYLVECRRRGMIRAVGVSTHRVACLRGVREICGGRGERPIDVVFPIINRTGLGIADGSVEEMLAETAALRGMGLGVMAMKALGGGNFYADAAASLRYVLSRPEVDTVMLGMRSADEVDADVDFFENGDFTPGSEERLNKKPRRLLVEEDCEGCGRCVDRCGQGALHLTENHETLAYSGDVTRDTLPFRAAVDPSKCVLCGYCASVCPNFAIKVV